MMQAQQRTIDELKNMVALLLAISKKELKKQGSSSKTTSSSKAETSSKGKGKEKEDEAGTPGNAGGGNDHESDILRSSSEEQVDSEHREDPHNKRIENLEHRLESMVHRSDLQDVGVIRPYPIEWDSAPYPSKFKAPNLHTFDGQGSPNQHVYYFKSQTGNVVSNDAILVCLFIGTLKGVAFEWFMKLPTGSIQKWVDLERLFLARFFEDDSEVSVPTLLAAKQKKGEAIKDFVKRF